jgi:5-methylcytosine-specific restriction endonuclease McrA
MIQEDLDERPDGSRDKAFEESKRAAFKRQSLTCVGCGNPDVARADLASGISHVFYASFDRTDTSAGNLYPACPICNDILTVGYAVERLWAI